MSNDNQTPKPTEQQLQQLQALNMLLEFSDSTQLQKSLRSMFHAYLLDVDRVMPLDYKDVVEDYHILIQFMEELETVMSPTDQ